jgi:hypothetical protein
MAKYLTRSWRMLLQICSEICCRFMLSTGVEWVDISIFGGGGGEMKITKEKVAVFSGRCHLACFFRSVPTTCQTIDVIYFLGVNWQEITIPIFWRTHSDGIPVANLDVDFVLQQVRRCLTLYRPRLNRLTRWHTHQLPHRDHSFQEVCCFHFSC